MEIVYTKENLIEKLKEIRQMGYIPNPKHGNNGSVGNLLEALLGIQENNLPIPNAAEWELKTQRKASGSFITLSHKEPSPTALKAVVKLLLPTYGWSHQKAGKEYPEAERSFRQTLSAKNYTDRGFIIQIDQIQRRLVLHFDPSKVSSRHSHWLQQSNSLPLLLPEQQPYWGFDDLGHSMGAKLTNCFFVLAETRVINEIQHVRYTEMLMLKGFQFNNFLELLAEGKAFVDFDARTGHNHGTKFRVRRTDFPYLYDFHESF